MRDAVSRKSSLPMHRTRTNLRRTLTRWREIAQTARGNLRVLRVAEDCREGVRFFDEPPRAALALMRRLKSAFDPRDIFNPGCFVGGL